MKIAIDFREGAKPTRAGKGEYIFQLMTTWLKAPSDEVILLLERGRQLNFALPANWRIWVVPATGLSWQLLVIGWLEFLRPVRLYFSSTSLIVPAFVRAVPVVTTIADFTVWRFPTRHLPRAVRIERLCMPLALRFSRHLLMISEFTRQEAIELFHIPPAKMTVTLPAVGSDFRAAPLAPDTISRLRQKYHLPENFFLYLGTLEPRKNIDRLLNAFALIAPEFPTLHLVLAGARGWFAEQLLAHQPDRVHLTGYIDAADRPALYQLAQAFVFPSLYEGFGLPPLEAMTIGTPVLTSRAASLPEVVGNAAVLVNPTDLSDLASGLRQLAGSASRRAELRDQGSIQARKFNWETTLKLTLQVFHRDD